MANGFRSQDTREKIKLGGLVVKAGLRTADAAFLLGGLLDLQKVAADPVAFERLQAIGQSVFKADAMAATARRADYAVSLKRTSPDLALTAPKPAAVPAGSGTPPPAPIDAIGGHCNDDLNDLAD